VSFLLQKHHSHSICNKSILILNSKIYIATSLGLTSDCDEVWTGIFKEVDVNHFPSWYDLADVGNCKWP